MSNEFYEKSLTVDNISGDLRSRSPRNIFGVPTDEVTARMIRPFWTQRTQESPESHRFRLERVFKYTCCRIASREEANGPAQAKDEAESDEDQDKDAKTGSCRARYLLAREKCWGASGSAVSWQVKIEF
ncbi:hypothetical protein LTR56_010001 [Elasticomyces elasticus]|nr:hypothetical protein LTR56_010001 [Elasticomyces elasticus]KAK3665061.1 hypothetical protein LTR22_004117 [Elasticomyces elasticus]KAK4931564.1 hypothetical protein LTR49_001952 [Elasticomyces elasticus]KAK5766724.1 hypothetical protein LTS12_003073 [Elasticomyces elasticus]